MRVGSTLSVTDGFGFIYECVLIEAHHKNCVVVIKHQFENLRTASTGSILPSLQQNRLKGTNARGKSY